MASSDSNAPPTSRSYAHRATATEAGKTGWSKGDGEHDQVAGAWCRATATTVVTATAGTATAAAGKMGGGAKAVAKDAAERVAKMGRAAKKGGRRVARRSR